MFVSIASSVSPVGPAAAASDAAQAGSPDPATADATPDLTHPDVSRLSPQTGFAVDDDQYWSYFTSHGGAAVLGNPISRPFTLRGATVQLFERQALQRGADQIVRPLNLVDLLPYSPIDGLQLPDADPDMMAAAPVASDGDYTVRSAAFVLAAVQDSSNGVATGFLSLYRAGVIAGDPSSGMAIGLDLWGLPTSGVVVDPTHSNVLVQRFERGFMVRDTQQETTRILPLGQYLKRVLWGEPDPPDLASQAANASLWDQYSPVQAAWLNRPGELPGTDLT